jgi:DivIVA domain-containing protein
MRRLFRRLLGLTHPQPAQPAQPGPAQIPRSRTPNSAPAGYYRSAASPPLSAGQVRDRQFRLARHGLDPNDVRGFLDRVAHELAAARAELANTREANVRIKTSLNAALKLARTLGRSITFLPDVDAAESTVSEEDNQGVRHQVFGNRLLACSRRCELKPEHAGDCQLPVRQRQPLS